MRSGALPGLLVLAALLASCATSPPAPASPGVVATPAPATGAVQPAPSATPGVAPPPPVPLVIDSPLSDLAAPRIRVLLERTSGAVTLPQPQRAWRVSGDGVERWLWGPLQLEVEHELIYQVGAWRDEQVATGTAYRLAVSLGPQVTVWRENAADGLVRVRARWPDTPAEDPHKLLVAAGFPAAMEVAGKGHLRVRGVGGEVSSEGELVLEPASAWPIAIGARQVRGRLRTRLGSGGDLLVVNELCLEAYLRGVVPVEMGPVVFPEVEALKAQAVAARTYAVAHLGDHDDEGYDLCATPACQAYTGFAAEHRLSDRAVAETAGLVATWQGAPIDAMYSSTCGGHTEDAALLFPDRAQPYLVGVACAWDRPLELRGSAAGDADRRGQTEFGAALAAAVLEIAPDASGGAVVAAVERALASSSHSEVNEDLDSIAAGLLAATGLATAGERLTPYETPLEQLLFLTDLYHVELEGPTAATLRWWPAAAAAAALEVRGDLVSDRGEAVPRPEGIGIFPRRAEHSEPLPSLVPLWEELDRSYRSRASLVVLPGTELERFQRGDRVVAVVVRRSGGDGEADRRSAWREWVRERGWSDLAAALGVDDLARVRITRRGASGRVVGLEAVGGDGRIRTVSGFDVRRALDLPDTLFAMHVRTDPDGARVVRFLGRGWGHGVGLCQHGAYGLARAGMTFDRILAHYYTGITIEPWDGAREAGDQRR